MSNYFTFWHIKDPVFVRPAGGDALFETPHVRELGAKLRQFAETHQPLAILSGAAGGGKTTMLRWLSDTLPMTTHDVFLATLLYREMNSGWFLPRLAGFFSTKSKAVKTEPADGWKNAIMTGMTQLAGENRHLIVCVDAAHLICSEEAMSDLEAFFNLLDHTSPRISVVLAGAPELAERIRKTPSLSLRVSTNLEVRPLERTELDAYVAWRLQKAGISAIFEAETLTMIHRQAAGNFLATGMALEKCLIEAAAKDSRRITPFIAERALDAVPQKKTVDDLFSPAPAPGEQTPATSAGEKQGAPKDPVKGKGTEQFPRKVVAEQVSRGKNETDKPGSIKLSSLFKQDDD